MQCEQALELISAALDGELTPSQRAALDAHLDECPSCAALFDELAGHARLLRQLDCQPPEDLTERILSRLPDQAPKKRPRWTRWGSLAACAALVVWAGLSLPRFAATKDSSAAVYNDSQVETQDTTANAPIPDPASLSPEDGVQPYADDNMAVYDVESEELDSAGFDAAPEVRSAGKSMESAMDAPDGPCAAPAEEPLARSVQYLRTTWTGGASGVPTAQLLSTRTALTDCLALYPEDDLSAVAEHYDDAYFETGCLLAVTVEEPSGSTTLQVETVAAIETGYQVTIRQETPEICTDDMASWLILIETETLQAAQEEVTLIIQD